jgi:hypothetical protein
MKKHILLSLLFLSALQATAQTGSKWEEPFCDYTDIKRDISVSGRCRMEEIPAGDHYAVQLTWPSGTRVRVEYVASQGGHHLWKINNISAAAIEINRDRLKGFTLDLNQFLEWDARPH